jgi:copper(I)-binding protein
MRIKSFVAAAALLFAVPAFAHDGVMINDAYARTNGASGATGAIFMEIQNHSDTPDQLIAVASDIAEKVELHTHVESADGVMQMNAVPQGFEIEPLMTHKLQRGGEHIMLMGLKRDLKDGDTFSLKLTFKHAGDMTIEVVVDNARKPAAMGNMGNMGGGTMENMEDMPGMTHGTPDAAPSN